MRYSLASCDSGLFLTKCSKVGQKIKKSVHLTNVPEEETCVFNPG